MTASARKIRRFACAIALLGGLMALSGAAPAQEKAAEPKTATLEITLTEIQADRGGDLIAALYRGEEGWMELEKAADRVTVGASGESVTVRFEGVPFGDSYAIQVFHDANRNGKLDFRRIIPIPTEGVGVSHNHERKGPPRYDKAAFAVNEGVIRLRIILRYY